MAIMDDIEKAGKQILKGGIRRGKKAAGEVEKYAEKGLKSAKGLAAQAAAKLKGSAASGTVNRAEQEMLKSGVDTSGVKMGPGARDRMRFPK